MEDCSLTLKIILLSIEKGVSQVSVVALEPVLLAGNSVPELARRVSVILNIPLTAAVVGRFADGEVRVEIDPNAALRDRTVFIIQSTQPPAEHWFELWLLADAARRAGASKIIWVAPYIGYGRQDRKKQGHDPISAKIVITNTVLSGVTEIIPVDLHCGQIQGYADIPISNLWGRKLIIRAILDDMGLRMHAGPLTHLAFNNPDAGSFAVASYYAGKYGAYLIPSLKNRMEPNKVEEIVLVAGDKAEDRDTISLDDMVDTATTLIGVGGHLKARKAKRVIAAATHPLFSGDAIERIEETPNIDLIYVTDTIPLKRPSPKIKVVSVADELAIAMKLVITGGIVSSLPRQD